MQKKTAREERRFSKVLSGTRDQRNGGGRLYRSEGGRHELSVLFAIYTECTRMKWGLGGAGEGVRHPSRAQATSEQAGGMLSMRRGRRAARDALDHTDDAGAGVRLAD